AASATQSSVVASNSLADTRRCSAQVSNPDWSMRRSWDSGGPLASRPINELHAEDTRVYVFGAYAWKRSSRKRQSQRVVQSSHERRLYIRRSIRTFGARSRGPLPPSSPLVHRLCPALSNSRAPTFPPKNLNLLRTGSPRITIISSER